jgi:hypothetical protein
MYMRDPGGDARGGASGAGAAAALTFAVVVVLALGVYPGPVLAWARLAARSL